MNNYIPMTAEQLAADMKARTEYYFGVTLTTSTINTYATRMQIPAIQQLLRYSKVMSQRGKKTFYPAEIRQWIAFGQSGNAVLEVLKQRDYAVIAKKVGV